MTHAGQDMSEGKGQAKYYCMGAFLIFVGSILLCTFGFTIVLPHDATKGWLRVPCVVINTTYEHSHCACATNVDDFDPCIDKYPCMQIHVRYVVPENVTGNFTAGPGVGYMYRYWNDAFHKTVSDSTRGCNLPFDV